MSRWPTDDEEEPDDEEALPEGEWELDPNDPSHPDYDLSEAAGYAGWEPATKPLLMRPSVIVFLALLIVAALTIPVLLRL